MNIHNKVRRMQNNKNGRKRRTRRRKWLGKKRERTNDAKRNKIMKEHYNEMVKEACTLDKWLSAEWIKKRTHRGWRVK